MIAEVFMCLDLLADKLDKIKPIADCYMVVSGPRRPRPRFGSHDTGDAIRH